MRPIRILSLALTLALALPAAPASAALWFKSAQYSGTDVLVGGTGLNAAGNGIVGGLWTSPDEGQTWTAKWSPPDAGYLGVSCGPANSWAVESLDNMAWSGSGTTWATKSPIAGLSTVSSFGSADFADVASLGNDDVAVVGELTDTFYAGESAGNLAGIWVSTDGGDTWTEEYLGPIQPKVGDEARPDTYARMEAVDSAGGTAIAVGNEWVPNDPTRTTLDAPIVMRSTNGGATWNPVTLSGVTQPLLDVDIAPDGSAWIVGESKTFLRSTDGGATWSAAAPIGSGTFAANGVAGGDEQHAIVAGDAGKVAYTSNGGSTWSYYTMAAPIKDLTAAAMRDSLHGIVVGRDETILRTADGGATWAAGPISKQPVALSIKTSSSAPSYGAAVTISGTLTSGGQALTGRSVALKRKSGTSWVTVKTSSSSTGSYSFTSIVPYNYSKTTYRLEISENATHLGNASTELIVTPKVYLSKPTISSRSGRSLTASGYLKPKHTADSSGSTPVKIMCYRSGVLKYTKYAKVYNYSTYSKYSARMTLPYSGSWKIRAYAPGDSGHTYTYSSYTSSFTVK
ncbi:MAG: hypothetical protein HY876_10625 [Coriobacteriales bacterium]|nr:hypothetical protein [Coriobacteriales bacterium]